MRDLPPLSEPTIIPDTFVSELTMVEHMGSCVRLVFAAMLRDCGERRVVARLIIPAELLTTMCSQIRSAAEEKARFPATVTGKHGSGFDA
jgi:hypothetical protein